MHSFNQEEIDQIKSRGSNIPNIYNQLEGFDKGFEFTHLLKPAVISNGILLLSDEKVSELVADFDSQIHNFTTLKFVPASGAASRMFKHLFEYINEQKEDVKVEEFITHISSFAFFVNLKKEIEKLEAHQVIAFLLTKSGLNYGQHPKGLIPFHGLNGEVRTAFQEHLVEGVSYASNSQREVNIHFTISEEHQGKFKAHLSSFLDRFQKQFDVKFNIGFSYQKPSTDTIAVDLQNNPVTKSGGDFLFRPGGHGALIQNLNELDADIIFIKNIDNVLPDNHKSDTVKYKKVLAAKLIELQSQIFDLIKKLESSRNDSGLIDLTEKFCSESLCINLDTTFQRKTLKEKASALLSLLNRPIRVCGMVENTGESGGGPFWVKMKDGTTNLQIVESAQINLNNDDQKKIMSSSTHFNPVDLVCATKNHLGEPFDLTQYIDYDSCFISEKSFEGKTIKALEHPGLWNGAMANWNTIFVEVPISTFNPVKTVNDLLKEEHQWSNSLLVD